MDFYKEYSVQLDISSPQIKRIGSVIRNDTEGNLFNIKLIDDGKAFDFTGYTVITFTVVKPDGAFYLFVQSLEPDSDAFAERAKQFELLLVSAKSFGVEGYVRVSYCVSPDMIERALPAFKALAESYKK